MSTAATERLQKLDHDVEALMDGFVGAISSLQSVTAADDTSLEEGWSVISQRLRELRHDLQPEDFDKEQIVAFVGALLDVADLAEARQSLDALDGLLIRFERMRHVVRDALDEHLDGATGDAAALLEELFVLLPASRSDVARLIGVTRRTLSRWSEGDRAAPHRLQVVARLVAVLRHNWTPDGTLAWFHRPRRDLAGATPLDVLGREPIDAEALLAAARAGRSQYAA